jgi:hypothetical protein
LAAGALMAAVIVDVDDDVSLLTLEEEAGTFRSSWASASGTASGIFLRFRRSRREGAVSSSVDDEEEDRCLVVAAADVAVATLALLLEADLVDLLLTEVDLAIVECDEDADRKISGVDYDLTCDQFYLKILT